MEPFSYLILIPFVSFLCYCILLVILLGSQKNRITKYYTLYVGAMIVWSFCSFIMKTDFPPSALFWNRILCIGMICMPVLFYHFTLVLTETTNQRNKLLLGYVSACILLVSNFFGMITKHAYAENNVFYYTLGPAASFLAVWSIFYMILAFINILDKVKKGTIPFIRVKYILYGLVLVIAGGLLNLLPSLGKYPLDIVLNTINALFIAYSIYRYRFLEIKLIVKQGIAYSVYTLALTGVYIIAIIAVQQILSALIGNTTITMTFAIAVMLAILFHPIKNSLQHLIDRLFYKDMLSHKTLLRDFSSIINNVLDLKELTDTLIQSIERGLQPKRVLLVLRENKNDYGIFYTSMKENRIQEIKFKSDHPIVRWFMLPKSILTMDDMHSLPFFAGLWSDEKKRLIELNTEMIVPIRLREQLIGFIILSEKKGGESYSQEEIDLLFTLANNAAVVIDNAKMYEEVKHQAITDGLTKLYNHRHFHELLSEYVYERKYDVFSIAMIDVDLFKLYNDLYGHSAGDRALVRISEILKEAVGNNDIIARYGGEEFAIIFPNIEGSDSLRAVETIRKAVEHSFLSTEDGSEFLTVSIGVASYPGDGSSGEEVLECADKAMYAAKWSGRNQCVLYSRMEEGCFSINSQNETEKMQNSIKTAYFSTVYALAATIDAKDHYTFGHSENVSSYAVTLAIAAGFDDEKIDIVRNAGLLHDIGKIGIPEYILTKNETLTRHEYEIMKRHVEISISIIKHIPSLIKVIPAIMSHHEQYDGKGYPRGVKGEGIPIEGRCLSIVDAFDAMTTDRPYRKALSIDEALEELRRCSGTQFDPVLTETFIKLFEDGAIHVA
ncbi:MAG: diguanylate cyclase [Bacillota bacterium]